VDARVLQDRGLVVEMRNFDRGVQTVFPAVVKSAGKRGVRFERGDYLTGLSDSDPTKEVPRNTKGKRT
jgi:hypothetical protein